MTMIMIEGFEQIDPSVTLTAANIRDLFLALDPDEDTGWFGSSGDSVRHETQGRIAGNCLTFTRGANASPSWSRDTAANLGFSFIPKQRASFGWGVRYSMAPLSPIPLALYRYDNGNGDQEQISLWATPDGKVYISTTTFNADFASQAVGINPAAVSAAGTFRFTQWTYFEFVVDYSGVSPRISVLVNGVLVLDNLVSASFLQLPDDPFVSSVHVINPTNGHFGNAGFWQRIDDIYLDDQITHGPQWIVGLTNGAITSNTGGGAWTGRPSDTFPAAGVVGDEWGSTVVWELSDPPAGVGTINAIGVNLIGDQAATIDAVAFGVANASNAGQRSTRRSISAGEPPKCLRFCTQTAPSTLTMTGPSLANMRGWLSASQVVT